MARLIDADALEKHIADTFGYPAADILHEIANFPTVDAVEVVHGYTTIAEAPTKVLLDRACGICNQLMLSTDEFCPMCGARNEGERTNDG